MASIGEIESTFNVHFLYINKGIEPKESTLLLAP